MPLDDDVKPDDRLPLAIGRAVLGLCVAAFIFGIVPFAWWVLRLIYQLLMWLF
jgi:hypothetical protein